MHRKNVQKPADELYASFKQDLGRCQRPWALYQTQPWIRGTTRFFNSRSSLSRELSKVTKKILSCSRKSDQNNPLSVFPTLANQDYYTLTSEVMNTKYNRQAGNLPTSEIAFHFGTPLSMPNSNGNIYSAILDMQFFQTIAVNPQQYYSSFVCHDSRFDAMNAEHDVCIGADPHRVSPMSPIRTLDASLSALSMPSIEKYFVPIKFIYDCLNATV